MRVHKGRGKNAEIDTNDKTTNPANITKFPNLEEGQEGWYI